MNLFILCLICIVWIYSAARHCQLTKLHTEAKALNSGPLSLFSNEAWSSKAHISSVFTIKERDTPHQSTNICHQNPDRLKIDWQNMSFVRDAKMTRYIFAVAGFDFPLFTFLIPSPRLRMLLNQARQACMHVKQFFISWHVSFSLLLTVSNYLECSEIIPTMQGFILWLIS